MTDTATAPVQAEATGGAIGRIARVTGPVVDIEFPHDSIPSVYAAYHQACLTLLSRTTE